MKGSSNIVSAVHCIAQAKAHFESFCLEYPGTKGEKLFSGYVNRLEWIAKDLKTNPFLTEEVRTGISKEWESDTFTVPAITEKAALVRPEQREMIETLLDAMLAGEEIKWTDENGK